ncbi:MAG: hypothetical protein OJF52_000485 [Nitrospira sp.]|nr:MAG: hypothetical protein OJF52_000485 [Nitrospira sp.]
MSPPFDLKQTTRYERQYALKADCGLVTFAQVGRMNRQAK